MSQSYGIKQYDFYKWRETPNYVRETPDFVREFEKWGGRLWHTRQNTYTRSY